MATLGAMLIGLALHDAVAFNPDTSSRTFRRPRVRLHAATEGASFLGTVPASREALASFGVEAGSSDQASAVWAASYPSNFEGVAAMESGPISLASAMADATGGQKLSLMKSTTTTTDSNIVGGSERYLAAAVARLDCDGALIDSIQARPPKEEVELFHGAVLSSVDACVLAWLKHLDASANSQGSTQHFQDLRVVASLRVGPMLGSRGFATIDTESCDFESLLVSARSGSSTSDTNSDCSDALSFASHQASLALAIACYRDLLAEKAVGAPSAPTALGSERKTAEEILELLQTQPPPPPVQDIASSGSSRDPWSGMKIF